MLFPGNSSMSAEATESDTTQMDYLKDTIFNDSGS
jgi:hypothetical protein